MNALHINEYGSEFSKTIRSGLPNSVANAKMDKKKKRKPLENDKEYMHTQKTKHLLIRTQNCDSLFEKKKKGSKKKREERNSDERITIFFHISLFALYILKRFMSVFHTYVCNTTKSTNYNLETVLFSCRISFHHVLQTQI